MPTENPPIIFPSLDQIAPLIPPVTWLWPGWIPRGMITLLCATPGAGKSYFALDLARRLIAGFPWPNGVPSAESDLASAAADAHVSPAQPEKHPNVIYVDAEAAPQLLNERAVAWGIDRTHLFPMLGVEAEGPLDLNAPACRARLTAMSKALRPALIIVDSLGSAARGAENHPSIVDALLGFLNGLAARQQCALLVIHHLRKNSARLGASWSAGAQDGSSISGDQVRGSGHIVSLARSVIGLTELKDLAAVGISLDPRHDSPRHLQILKSNLVANAVGAPAPLGITFVSRSNGCADLVYGPPAVSGAHRNQVDSCARWLLDILGRASGPLGPKYLIQYAYEAGYSRAALFRARDLLGSRIVDTVGHGIPGNCWTLPPWPRPKPATSPGSR